MELSGGLLLLVVTLTLMEFLVAGSPAGGEDGRDAGGSGQTTPPSDLPRNVIAEPPETITCPMRNKCSRREDVRLSYHDRNCFCDDLCRAFGDCCKDYVGTGKGSRRLQKSTLKCARIIEIDPEVELFIVDSCPKDFSGEPEIREKCEMDTSLAWGNGQAFFRLPVTGTTSRIMYKNYYCALCSGDTAVKFWQLKLGCGEIPVANRSADPNEIVEQVLTYTRQNKYFCGLEFAHPGIPPRHCKSHIARCDKSWKDPKIKRKCKSQTSYVYVGKEVFKNKYCAVCNYVNESYLSCEDTRTPLHAGPAGSGGEAAFGGDITAPFSVLLDINTGRGRITEQGLGSGSEQPRTETLVEVRKCPAGHVYDPFARICRQLICPRGFTSAEGVCVDKLATALVTKRVVMEMTPGLTTNPTPRSNADLPGEGPVYPTDRPVPEEPEPETSNVRDGMLLPGEAEEDEDGPDSGDTYTDESYDSGNHVDIPDESSCPVIALYEDEYRMFDNLTIVVYSSGHMYMPMEYDEVGGIVYLCTPYDNGTLAEGANATDDVLMFQFDRLQGLVSFVGILVSVVALLIMIVVHVMLPPLRTIPGMSVMNLGVALIFAQLLFLVGIKRTELFYVCLALGAAMHYTHLVAFFWVNVLAYDIWRSFSAALICARDKNAESTCRFACYTLYAWLGPAAIVGGSVGLDFLDQFIDDVYRPHYGDAICWIVRRYAILLFFALPLAIILVVNIIFYIATIRRIYLISKASKSLHQQQKIKDKGKLVLYIKLSFIMGLTWIFGFMAIFSDMHVMWYAFIAFNTLQGIFICCAFVCNKKVFRLLRDKGRVHRMHQYNDSAGRYGNSHARTYMTRHTYLSDGEAKIISQETSI